MDESDEGRDADDVEVFEAPGVRLEKDSLVSVML